VHEALNDNDDGSSNGCGDPMHYESGTIIMDSFDINEWITTLSKNNQ
jgi:hypothetical protein